MNETMKSRHKGGLAPHPVPLVNVERHQPDLDDPGAPVWRRIESLAGEPPTCLFVNPIATVTCNAETPEFFRAARKQQASWCRRYKQLFGRRVVRSVKNWASWKDFPNSNYSYLDRAAIFTGMLLINGEHIPPRKWPDLHAKHQHSPTHPIVPNVRFITS